jgi:hypothetical protein
MGQLNRPLQAPPEPPAAAESALSATALDAPSGLPGTPPPVKPVPDPPEAVLETADTPSGLPVGSGADQAPAPSGLWGMSRSQGRPSGLAGVPSAPATAWTAAPDTDEPTPSGLPFRTETGGDEPAS